MANTGKLETYKTTTGKFRWRLVTPNGKAVATSADGFDTEALARRAAKAAKDRAGKAEVVEKAAAAGAGPKPAVQRAVAKAKPVGKKVASSAKPAAKKAGAAAKRSAAAARRRAA